MATDWNDPNFWVKNISKAANKRESFAGDYEWKKIREILDTGAHRVAIEIESDKQDARELSESSFVNWLWAFAQTFIPAVYWKHPKINIMPQRHMYQVNVNYVEPIINAALEQTKFRRTLQRVILDVLCYGHGWAKLGWFTRVGQVPNAVVTEEEALLQKPTTVDTDISLKFDEPYTKRISPERILMDPYASEFDELGWIIQESYVSYEGVKRDPYLKNTRDVAPLVFANERPDAFLPVDTSNDFETHDARWCRLFEIWDRENRVVRFLLQGSPKWNRIIDWPYSDIEGFPFKMLAVTDSIHDIYPVSPMLPWLPLVEELAFIRSMRMNHLSKMQPKAILPPNLFDPDAMRDFLDPTIEAVHAANDPKGIFTWPGLKPDANLYASEDSVKSDIREISGFSEILSGQVPFSRIAATTSAIMERNATIRFDHYAERIGDFIIECSKDLFTIIRKYQPYPQVVQITGDPEPQWIEIGEKELRGSYYFKLDLEEMSVSSKQQKIKEAYDNLLALSQFPEVKRDMLIRDFISATGKNNLNEYLNPSGGPPLDPFFENTQMIQGIPIEPSPNEDFQLHLQVHGEFVQSRDYVIAVSQQPAIGTLFSEHIQKTSRMADLQQQLGPPVGTRASQQVRTNQSIQQGQAQAGSQPVGGQSQGNGQQQLAQQLARARGI